MDVLKQIEKCEGHFTSLKVYRLKKCGPVKEKEFWLAESDIPIRIKTPIWRVGEEQGMMDYVKFGKGSTANEALSNLILHLNR